VTSKKKVSKNKKIASQKKTSKRKGPSMDELLKKYGTQVKSMSFGDKVQGKILEITPKRVVVDIGGKSEGLVAEKAYKEAENLIKTLKVGENISASVIVPETPEGFTILSLRQTVQDVVWKRLEEAYKKGSSLIVDGKLVTQAGIVADIGGLNAFIPKSQLGREVSRNPQSLIGKSIKVKVIDLDRDSNRIVLSEKQVSEKKEIELARKAMKGVKKGDVYEGVVTSIYDFGCFVRIKVKVGADKKQVVVPLEGLVHISEISWDKVDNLNDIVTIGDKVKVKVIGKDIPAGKQGIDKPALSIKQAQKDPWESIEEKYAKEVRVKGKVVRVSDFGMFVVLEPGVEGLVHVTKIPPGKKFSKGDEVSVYIEEVDGRSRKMSLGLVLTEKPVGYK
jgi:small subunit ribosomal protein S1